MSQNHAASPEVAPHHTIERIMHRLPEVAVHINSLHYCFTQLTTFELAETPPHIHAVASFSQILKQMNEHVPAALSDFKIAQIRIAFLPHQIDRHQEFNRERIFPIYRTVLYGLGERIGLDPDEVAYLEALAQANAADRHTP